MTMTFTYIDGVLTVKGHNGDTLHWSNPAALKAALEAEANPPSETEISSVGLARFGNMVSNHGNGLTAIFDGNPVKNFVPGGWYPPVASNAYAGLALGSAKAISKAIVYASADHGFAYTENANVTLTLYGKNGAPTAATDGTVLATNGPFMDANGLVKELVVPGPTLTFTHAWVNITYAGTVVNGCALIRMFELN